jgi:hypothetical protein
LVAMDGSYFMMGFYTVVLSEILTSIFIGDWRQGRDSRYLYSVLLLLLSRIFKIKGLEGNFKGRERVFRPEKEFKANPWERERVSTIYSLLLLDIQELIRLNDA